MAKTKIRADQLAHEQGLAPSREHAKRLIMAGQIFVGNPPLRVEKPGTMYTSQTTLTLAEKERFVSRGAYKLLTALEYFKLSVEDLVCLDAGASTGGFTDCLLQHGAKMVYAVDVGHNQLHENLLNDARVINLEKTNLRTAAAELIPEPVQLVVADVSFISLTLVLRPCMQWLERGGKILALIKPQFEVGPHQTHKGVVKDAQARQEAIDKVVSFCTQDLGLAYIDIVPSAILGPKGNQEYLALFVNEPKQQCVKNDNYIKYKE